MPEKTIGKYYDEIFRYCFHHVESRAAAEDLCQDTFLSFIERYGQNRSGSKVKNLLYTIAKNKCRDYYKKQTPLYMADVPERETGECVEEEVVVRQMVMELPEKFREAVVLRYFQNLKYTDMAVILQVSTSLVKYRVKKGLELLSAMEGGGHGKKKD